MATSNWLCCKFMFLKCTRWVDIQKVLKIFGIFLSIHLITFHLILPYALRNHPYSSYFSPTWNVYQRALDLNEDRIKLAEGYLGTVNAAKSREMYSNTNTGRAKFVIGIVTVARVSYEKSVPQPRYLSQVVAKVHKLLAESPSKLDYQLFMCNVDDQGGGHSEAIYLSNFIRMVTKNENGNSNFHSRRNKWEREKLDYNYCLEQAWLYDTKYAILIQDDTLPHSNFIEVLEYLVSNHLEHRIQGGRLTPNLEKWAWLKLNFPENLAGFLRNWRFVLEWISISATLASIFTLFVSCRYRHTSPVCFLYIMFFLSLFLNLNLTLAIGRPFFINIGNQCKYSYTIKPATSCCLPAVLYPSKNIPGILKYLENTKCNTNLPLDFALPNYAEQSGMKEYLASPNLFTHVGMYSALHHRINSRTAWAYLKEV